MSLIKKTLAAAVLSATAMSASAALMEVQSQTQNYSDLTVWTQGFTFNLYDPSLEGGKALEKVVLSLYGDVVTTISFTSTTDTYVSGDAGALVMASNSVTGTAMTLDVSPADSFGDTLPGELVAAGTTVEVGPLTGEDSAAWESTNTSDLLAFTGPGTFDVDLSAFGQLDLTQLGGNVSSDQVTTASGTYTVTYFVDDAVVTPPSAVPVPGTLALMGLGLLALSARKRSKSA